ncbi:HNH endonuclease signature motif containing protein [Clostridium tyrobutyricum]|uniref:HNH endonuclease signature motif containing protein n=1 Tax=Clostridium tyrobutyricum TaxID=1519 RepID=UPI001A9B12BD|nr:HNH endonuclease signature motif containing protein [Clostridium tyrobutyricum]
MAKIICKCLFCGKEFKAYASAKRKFCSSECSYKYKSKKYNPKSYKHNPALSKLNKKLNPSRMTDDIKAKLCLLSMGCGERKSYPKIHGKHIHRVVVEIKLGRKLKKGEVVHHIDGNIQNNSPENLMVFKSQAEHAAYHYKLKRNR